MLFSSSNRYGSRDGQLNGNANAIHKVELLLFLRSVRPFLLSRQCCALKGVLLRLEAQGRG
jgi:hypothetical protein